MASETAKPETLERYVQRVAASQRKLLLDGVTWDEHEDELAAAESQSLVENLLRTLKRDPHVLAARRQVAQQSFRDGVLASARELQEELVDAASETLGEDSPDALAIKSDLALTLSEQGELQRAGLLQMEILDAYIELYGEDDSLTLDAKLNLALTARRHGEFETALQLQRDVLNARILALGFSHPVTAAVAGLVAETEQRIAVRYDKYVREPIIAPTDDDCGGC